MGDEWGLHESRWWPVETFRPVAALMKVDFPTPVLPITRTIEGDGLPFCDILEERLEVKEFEDLLKTAFETTPDTK